jgi:DNA repair protein RadA/Sms
MQTLEATTHTRPRLWRADEVETRDMKWLWYPYIPFGAATMIFGPGGMGKSHLACDIAARVTTGVAFPHQTITREPGNVLMLSAEDDMNVVLVPRLKNQKVDLHRVFIPDSTFVLDKVGMRDMEEYMSDCHATVVFIDPVVSFIGGKVDINKANEVREFTGALHQHAMRTGTAVIIVHHSRKGRDGEDYDKAMGSADFNNAMRSVLFASQHPTGQGRILKHVKSNYSALGPAIAYDFGPNDTIIWGETFGDGDLPWHAKPGRLNDAISFLTDLLKDGPVRAPDVMEAAKAQGINSGTLNRAKHGIADSFQQRENGRPVWYWVLDRWMEEHGDAWKQEQTNG